MTLLPHFFSFFYEISLLYNVMLVSAVKQSESVIAVCCSVTQSCLTLCYPMKCSMPGFPVFHHLPELAQTHVHWSVMPFNHLILCRPLLLLPSVFPSIRVFSNELALRIRWPKYCSFSFSPSNEYSGLISFKTDWFDLLAVQGTLRVFSNTTVKKHQFLSIQPSL